MTTTINTMDPSWTYADPIPETGEDPMESVSGVNLAEQGKNLEEMMTQVNKAETPFFRL